MKLSRFTLGHYGLLTLWIVGCAAPSPNAQYGETFIHRSKEAKPMEHLKEDPQAAAISAGISIATQAGFYNDPRIGGRCDWVLSRETSLTSPCQGIRAQVLDSQKNVIADTVIERGEFQTVVPKGKYYSLRLKLPERVITSPEWRDIAAGDYVTLKIEKE